MVQPGDMLKAALVQDKIAMTKKKKGKRPSKGIVLQLPLVKC